MKKITLSLIILLNLFGAQVALAGFGITPPYVKNEALTRNSIYSQKIIIVRGDPVEDLRTEITVNVPGANDWFTIDTGHEFILRKGARQVPMNISVKVPEDAEFKTYSGAITIKTSSVDGPQAGTIGIALGAQINVDLIVIDKEIFEFRVRSIRIQDLEEGRKFWWLFYPGKIQFNITVENTGNVPVTPTKVTFDIYDARGQNLLETTKNIGKLEKVAPFETKEILSQIPTRLKPGSYKAVYKIFNREEIVQQGEVHVSILPRGTLPGYKTFGFRGLRVHEQLSIVLIILGILGLILYLGRNVLRGVRKKK